MSVLRVHVQTSDSLLVSFRKQNSGRKWPCDSSGCHLSTPGQPGAALASAAVRCLYAGAMTSKPSAGGRCRKAVRAAVTSFGRLSDRLAVTAASTSHTWRYFGIGAGARRCKIARQLYCYSLEQQSGRHRLLPSQPYSAPFTWCQSKFPPIV